MITIRLYKQQDSVEIGKLIAATYTNFNLSHIHTNDLALFLGPFAHAYSADKSHKQTIVSILHADITLVAEIDHIIAGALRGNPGKLQSLFVSENYQRQGVGRTLVRSYKQICLDEGSPQIKVQATLYAVPFYLVMGYKRSTGIRRMTSFDGKGLPYQPMEKNLLAG